MMDTAVSYGVTAWIISWWLDLLWAMVIGPLSLILILKFVVVTLCVAMIVWGLSRHGFLRGA